jgi:uncharacterized protein (UPF0276 family)
VIPTAAGIGLKREHHRAILETQPDVGWFEIHAENHMGAGGPPHRALEAIRRDYPLSIHAVGLSLGSADPLDTDHLVRLRRLIDRYEPGLVSEHLTWSAVDGAYWGDLLPIPYNDDTLTHLADRVARTQDWLGRPILLENPSGYLRFAAATIEEADFLVELAGRTSCQLLLDINNIAVGASNLGFSPLGYLQRIPPDLVGEIHLAGHRIDMRENMALRIDDHGSPVTDEVWNLYRWYLRRAGRAIPTLIEWDNNVPDLERLVAEAARADQIRTNEIDHALVA